MISIAGIADIKSSAEIEREQNRTIVREVRESGGTLLVEYDSIASRLTSPVRIRRPNDPDHTIDAEAVWDTGSTGTVISQRLAEEFRLQPVDTGYGSAPGWQGEVLYYIIDLKLSERMAVHGLKVVSMPLGSVHGDCLIGMDVIRRGNFFVRSMNGKTKLSFSMR